MAAIIGVIATLSVGFFGHTQGQELVSNPTDEVSFDGSFV